MTKSPPSPPSLPQKTTRRRQHEMSARVRQAYHLFALAVAIQQSRRLRGCLAESAVLEVCQQAIPNAILYPVQSNTLWRDNGFGCREVRLALSAEAPPSRTSRSKVHARNSASAWETITCEAGLGFLQRSESGRTFDLCVPNDQGQVHKCLTAKDLRHRKIPLAPNLA